MEKKIKLIIDTDNGSDIDDICVLYFAMHSNVEIVGVICSYLNTQLRTLQIKHALKLNGFENVPVFAGCGHPLKGLHSTDVHEVYCQYTPILGMPNSDDYSGEDAVDFLISKAQELGDELHILEIAPETTLATAIKKNKNAFKNSHIHIMGGKFYEKGYEWNIECDYEAARIVAESDLDISYIGLNVCDQTEIKDQKIKDLFFIKGEDEKLNYLVECVNLWQKTESRGIILYDPIAFLSIVDDSICHFETENIAYSFEDNHAYLSISSQGNKAKIAKTIDINKLTSYIYKLFNKENA